MSWLQAVSLLQCSDEVIIFCLTGANVDDRRSRVWVWEENRLRKSHVFGLMHGIHQIYMIKW